MKTFVTTFATFLLLLTTQSVSAQVSVSVMPIERAEVTYSIGCETQTCRLSITIYHDGAAVSFSRELSAEEAARFVCGQISRVSDTLIAMSGETWKTKYLPDEGIFELYKENKKVRNFESIDDLRRYFQNLITKNL